MKSLRARLFLSVGAIFLIVAILSYFLPKILVSRDINLASSCLNEQVNTYRKKIEEIGRSWITYQFLHLATQLNTTSGTIESDGEDIWKIATTILRDNPSIAWVQVNDQRQQSATIDLEGMQAYTPAWARDQEEKLWVKIGDRAIFATQPLDKNIFLLFPSKGEKGLIFKPFKPTPSPEITADDSQKVYQELRAQENLLLQKIELIQRLIPWRQKALGILGVGDNFETGMALLSDEVFPALDLSKQAFDQKPFVLYREKGPYVDLAQKVDLNTRFSAIVGFSLTELCRGIAKRLQKPILLYHQKKLMQAFTPEGDNLPLQQVKVDQKKIEWLKNTYLPSPVQIAQIGIEVLTPIAEVNQASRFLKQFSDALINKISLNLLLVAALLFGIALLLLARTSRKITGPITLLADAAEEIAKGKYENLPLPAVGKRKDEVEILSHSFQKMVLALRDREKIRGVLNKVVSKEIATQILNSNIELGGEQRLLTMLFSDIRGFTSLSETLSAQKLLDLLNSYMTRMCRIVDETQGVVDKFVGDEIMALYGAPLDLEDHAQKGVEAALLMIEDLYRWNDEQVKGTPLIEVGIGIHTGIAFAGNMGAENRLNYTVVGANVNLAARLCSAAKPMQILISEPTFQALSQPQLFSILPLNPISLKGIDQPVPVYQVKNKDSYASNTFSQS